MRTYPVLVLCYLGLSLERIGCMPELGNFGEANYDVDQETFVSQNAWSTEGYEEKITSQRIEQSVKPDRPKEQKTPYITISPSGPTLKGTPAARDKKSFYYNYSPEEMRTPYLIISPSGPTLNVTPAALAKVSFHCNHRRGPIGWSIVGGNPHVRLEGRSEIFGPAHYDSSTRVLVNQESFSVQHSIQFQLYCQINRWHKYLNITVDPIPAFYPCNLTVNCSEDYDQNSVCFTSDGESRCSCRKGYKLQKYGCQRIDTIPAFYPCSLTINCSENYIQNSVCLTSDGETRCSCKERYRIGKYACGKIDYDSENICDTALNCAENFGKNSICISKRCFCKYGYKHGELGCQSINDDTEIRFWETGSFQLSMKAVFFCLVCVIIGIFSVLFARRTRACRQRLAYTTRVPSAGVTGQCHGGGGGAFPVSDSGGNGEWNGECIVTSLISDNLVQEIWEDKPPAYEEVMPPGYEEVHRENPLEPGSPPPAYSTLGSVNCPDPLEVRSGNINEHACVARLAEEARQDVHLTLI